MPTLVAVLASRVGGLRSRSARRHDEDRNEIRKPRYQIRKEPRAPLHRHKDLARRRRWHCSCWFSHRIAATSETRSSGSAAVLNQTAESKT